MNILSSERGPARAASIDSGSECEGGESVTSTELDDSGEESGHVAPDVAPREREPDERTDLRERRDHVQMHDGGCARENGWRAASGDLVRVREATWRIVDVRTFARVRLVRLVGADAGNRWQPCTLLEPFDRLRPLALSRTPRVVSRARWMRTLAALVATTAGPDVPATVARAQVRLMPHQIAPLLALLRGDASRLLLADAVGLGKTIQAALILRELRARGRADRVLVLVPSGLRDQWQQELSYRTSLPSLIIDAASLAARARELPPDLNPWTLPGIHIVSLDFIKQAGVLRGVDRIAWDILIVDEAHGVNEGTDRMAAVDLLARRSRHVLLLTATPHHGSDEAFAALCRIGRIQVAEAAAVDDAAPSTDGAADAATNPTADAATIPATAAAATRPTAAGATNPTAGAVIDPVETVTINPAAAMAINVTANTATNPVAAAATNLAVGVSINPAADPASDPATGVATNGAPDADPIAIFRRTRLTMGMTQTRRGHVCRVALTAEERWLHTLLARYARRVERDRLPGDAAALALSVLLKRASSSASSLERSLRRRLALLESADEQPPTVSSQPSLPFGDGRDPSADARHNDDDDLGDGDPIQWLRAPGLRSRRIERAWLALLIQAARNAAACGESKPRALARWLRRVREPALIYTEYRDTLTHFASTLPRDLSCAVLHGGLGVEARRAALSRFTTGDARILLTTDAAGEGLNLHHRCRLVFNVELPWNPNRLEQRIGRVDRLGQTRRVHAVHLVAAAAAEEQMLDRLMGRIHRIAATLGDAPDVVAAAARPRTPLDARETRDAHAAQAVPSSIAAAHPTRIGDDAAPAKLAIAAVPSRELNTQDAHAAQLLDASVVVGLLHLIRAAQARAWRRAGKAQQRHVGVAGSRRRADPLLALDGRAPLVAVARRGLRGLDVDAPGLLCIWRTRVLAENGRARPSVLTALHLACAVPRRASRRALASFVTSAIARCRERVDALLDRELVRALRRFDDIERPWRERLARRDTAIADTLRAGSDALVQPLLFEEIAAERARTDGEEGRHRPSTDNVPEGGECRTRAHPQAAPRPAETAGMAPSGSQSIVGAHVDRMLALVLVLRR